MSLLSLHDVGNGVGGVGDADGGLWLASAWAHSHADPGASRRRRDRPRRQLALLALTKLTLKPVHHDNKLSKLLRTSYNCRKYASHVYFVYNQNAYTIGQC